MQRFLIFPLIFLAGCYTLDKEVITPIKKSWDYIGPQYVEYVDKDTSISDELKVARINHALELTGLLEDASKLGK